MVALEDLGCPKTSLFHVGDLDDDSAEEDKYASVVNAVLWLKRQHELKTGSRGAGEVSKQLSARMPRTSEPAVPDSNGSSNRGPAAGAGGAGVSGVTKLMQECTVLLKAKMSYTSTQMTPRSTDAFSFDAVGPVLESVLGGLTQVRPNLRHV